ncbi:MAG: bifunctional diguanylate cyclase/phosphodiesterase [Caryophanon sp.]|nr:bifunctional diguanylate cyclase/phosphodiesterase [Caryophanon sp.]
MLFVFILVVGGSFLDKLLSNHFKLIDSLTKLPNRYAFMKLLSHQEKAKSVAMFSIRDLHLANHEYNFIVEDKFIEAILAELQRGLPPFVDIYRIREHYFVYVMKDCKASEEMERYFEKKMLRLKEVMATFPQEVSCKVMVCIDSADHAMTVRDLYTNVMTVDKHPSTEGNYSIIHYQKGYHTRNFSEQLLADLDASLAKNELFVVYQPKVCPIKKRVISAEALIRWQHPEFGFVSPAVFVPILEANNRMNEVTNWVIRQVCEQLKRWGSETAMPQHVSINISASYLSSPLLKDELLRAVKLYAVRPEQIELEVTETSFVNSIEQATRAIEELRNAGFSLAIDDFGIGVSSLAYLKEFKFSTLKVDKSFVDHVPQSTKDNFILQSILSLGESLQMELVVEGVETQEQAEFLGNLQKNLLIQGYYYSKPLTAKDFEAWCVEFTA